MRKKPNNVFCQRQTFSWILNVQFFSFPLCRHQRERERERDLKLETVEYKDEWENQKRFCCFANVNAKQTNKQNFNIYN